MTITQMDLMIELVQRFNGCDFSTVTTEEAIRSVANECFKHGLSSKEVEAVLNQVNFKGAITWNQLSSKAN